MKVPNYNAPMVNEKGELQSPFREFLQQFTQPPAPIVEVEVDNIPHPFLLSKTFEYEAKQPGIVVINGGNIQSISLTRGKITLDMELLRSFYVTFKDLITIVHTPPINPELKVSFLPTYITGN